MVRYYFEKNTFIKFARLWEASLSGSTHLRVGSENSLLDIGISAKKRRVFGFWSRSRRSEGVRSSPLDMVRLSTYTLDFLKKKNFLWKKLFFRRSKKFSRKNFFSTHLPSKNFRPQKFWKIWVVTNLRMPKNEGWGCWGDPRFLSKTTQVEYFKTL